MIRIDRSINIASAARSVITIDIFKFDVMHVQLTRSSRETAGVLQFQRIKKYNSFVLYCLRLNTVHTIVAATAPASPPSTTGVKYDDKELLLLLLPPLLLLLLLPLLLLLLLGPPASEDVAGRVLAPCC
jgi:hypothetical protein